MGRYKLFNQCRVQGIVQDVRHSTKPWITVFELDPPPPYHSSQKKVESVVADVHKATSSWAKEQERPGGDINSDEIYNSWSHHRQRRIILKLIDKIWFSFLNTKTWFPRRLMVVGRVADWWQHLRVWVPWSWAARVPGARVISVIKGSGSGHDDDSAAPAGGRTNNGLYSLLYSLPWFCLTGPAERSGTICSRPCHVYVLRPVDHLGGLDSTIMEVIWTV